MMVAENDPTVQLLQEEIAKSLPAIAATKDQLESLVGGPVGLPWVVLAIFIIFCGRGAMNIIDKLATDALDERKLRREQARAGMGRHAPATSPAPPAGG